ncbi:MAG TPA: ArsI/CadI family heavy metal resistance metalloenzyme [Candidatus Acidoferrales bacterium]|jgi:catechol 2,3-dioxygenase-like lactoylglutathione lyase family enzyme|nr:ArsI/CadI family heavy metal resistance metalloenzyme [Candidatus Acidoferrales bacterium]
MKTHLNFATADLAKSVGFYTTLFDAKPVKLLDDYALFITDDPGLELALDVRRVVVPGDAHYGVCVDEVDDVERAIARLHRADLISSIERDVTCCYAGQTKVWAVDPDGRRWEIYTVHHESVERNGSQSSCCADNEGRPCCVA